MHVVGNPDIQVFKLNGNGTTTPLHMTGATFTQGGEILNVALDSVLAESDAVLVNYAGSFNGQSQGSIVDNNNVGISPFSMAVGGALATLFAEAEIVLAPA